MHIFFLDRAYKRSPISGIPLYNLCSDKSISPLEIGDAFDSCYQQLLALELLLPDNAIESSDTDIKINQFRYALELIKNAALILDNGNDASPDLMEYLNILNDFDSSLYGKRYTLYCDSKAFPHHPDIEKAIIAISQGNLFCATYECRNLLETCGAILDYVSRFRYYAFPTDTLYKKISLRRCKRCGHYFSTLDRRVIYCRRKDANGKTCAEICESLRKKKYAVAKKSPQNNLADKIRHRLYAYLQSGEYSCKTQLEVNRAALYTLWVNENHRHKLRPCYEQWLQEMFELLPPKKGSYELFYKGLQERSKKWPPSNAM